MSFSRSKNTDSDVTRRLSFFKELQRITTRIHAARHADELILKLSEDICQLFGAERLTIYTRFPNDPTMLLARVNTGIQGEVRQIKLPVSADSIAGFVAETGQLLNISDVYDGAELKNISAALLFHKNIDEQTGYRSRQMLVAPATDPETQQHIGVIQLINQVDNQPFEAALEEGLAGLAQTLAVAFSRQATLPAALRSRYDALIVDGLLSYQEFEYLVKTCREQNKRLESELIGRFGFSSDVLGDAAARFFNLPYEPYNADRIKPTDLLKHLKRDFVEQNLWIPLEDGPEGIVIMAFDPELLRTSRQAENIFPHRPIVLRITTQRDFHGTVDQFFGSNSDSVEDLLFDLVDDEQDVAEQDELSAAADNELVKLVNKIIIDAHRQGASDIHVEPRPGKEKTLVRFRRDGSLQPYIQVPAHFRNPLITRIKIMADLDISERRRPQDGKIRFRRFAPLDIELRVATLPTANGMEDVVMRVLANSEPIALDQLGLSADNFSRLSRTIAQPYGIFFVCGPTGSGKTTTLHSILGHLNTPERKIWTAEDPVEITQKGLRQVQVNRKAGLDFSVMMRAFLRADPDVIMVGEMRDIETVSVGIEASLTGHLVLSTLHTNSAPESVTRLLDMGMDPFNFADALIGVLAQRLIKRLCSSCRESYVASADEIALLLDEYCLDLRATPDFTADYDAARARVLNAWKSRYADDDGQFILSHAVGCTECSHGYRGRVGVHELMLGSDALKRAIQTKALASDIAVQALTDGMRTLRQDGIEKVLSGVTDMHQVTTVCVR